MADRRGKAGDVPIPPSDTRNAASDRTANCASAPPSDSLASGGATRATDRAIADPATADAAAPAPAVTGPAAGDRANPSAGIAQLVTAAGGGTLDFAAMLAIADTLPVMVAYVTPELRLGFVNKPLADWLETPRGQLLGAHVADVLGPSQYEVRKPHYARALAGERVFFTNEFDHPTRGFMGLLTHFVPWADASGRVSGFLSFQLDMTEQRKAERALRESEERFRRIANSAPAMMWVTRLDRTRDFVNDAYAAFACGPDCDSEAAKLLDWRSTIHPDDVERIVAESVAGEASLAPFTLEARFRRHDGEYRWLRSVSQPRFGPDGELAGYIGSGSDVTLEKEAELALRREVEERTAQLALSEAQFRAVFEAALEVMVLLKPDGTIIAANHRREAWRDADPSRSIGQKIWESPTMGAYPQHLQLIKDGIAQAARGEVYSTEVKMERPGVPTAFLDVSVQPVRADDGEIIYLLFEARDITDLKTAQEQLRQSQKMEALGQLTGGIAHDFNNLLTVVVGSLDIIAKRADDPKLKRYADNALAAAERGARLTGQLLAFSRVQRLEVRPIAVAPLIETLRSLLRNVLGPGITKTFELEEGLAPIMADPTQLEVAILNLAINARDAMPGGGVLTLSARSVALQDAPDVEDGDYVELGISDTGSGMPPEVAERAFEPFFTTKEVGKGTGLGLSMVYGMARQSGGTARIESRPGEGTIVRLLFRKADSAASLAIADAEEPTAAMAPSASLSVLVIDDDPDVRGFIATSLEEVGYRVRQGKDGQAGLAELEREQADLVILDFIMPGLSGAEVARQILDKTPGQPILFVTGYSETDAVKRTAPDAPLLAKPFRAEALQKAVVSALKAAQ